MPGALRMRAVSSDSSQPVSLPPRVRAKAEASAAAAKRATGVLVGFESGTEGAGKGGTPPNIYSAVDSTLTPGEAEIVSIFVQLAQTLGAPRSIGEIYGLLFASPQPLAFQEIVDRLHMSKGSASQGLRFLRTVGAIKPVYVTGDRRDYFEPVVELKQLVHGFLREKVEPQLASWKARSKALKTTDFPPLSQAGPQGQILSDRVAKLQTWQKRAGAVLPMLTKLLG